MASSVTNTGATVAKPAARVSRRRPGVDLATVLGLMGGFGLIITATVLGGTPKSFVDLPAMLIVVGGTFAVTTVCFSLSEVLQAQRIVFKAMVRHGRDPVQVANHVLRLAVTARKSGILALQNYLPDPKGAPLLRKALMMVIDGVPGDLVERLLHSEVEATVNRHMKGAAVLRKAAEVSPAMGLIGTLVGLVQMLGNLEDPATIGPAMAVALLTTFYGAVLANMVFSPLATKLERNSSDEALTNTIYVMAATSIGRQENPRRLEMLINSILPPNKRVKFFD